MKETVAKMSHFDRFLALTALLGVVVAVISLFRGIVIDRRVQVEYLGENRTETKAKIMVDIEGAVVNPGVYELEEGARLKDVLVLAGGLAERADREYCEKNLNMAEPVKDSQKIYVPSVDNTNTSYGYYEPKSDGKRVSVNTASAAELDTLWGIGEAKAEQIINGRPYQSLSDLVSKKIISQSVLDRNAELMVLY